jgi:hypothetical protein
MGGSQSQFFLSADRLARSILPSFLTVFKPLLLVIAGGRLFSCAPVALKVAVMNKLIFH